jgi:polyisoprenoid-binding protein YceI
VYRIDATQSEARYEVGETFFQDNRFAVAVGTTQGIAGELLIDFTQPANSQIGDIVIDVSQFTSDESRRDNFIRNNGLESAAYPLATFSPQSIDGLPAQIADGDSVSFTMTGDLTVKETTRGVTWDVTLTPDGDRIAGTASTEILMSDFGVGPIQLAFLATEDQVKLVFDFVAVRGEA